MTNREDSTIRLWDAFTGELRATLQGHRGKLDTVAFSDDGSTVLLTRSEDRTVRLWDARTGQAGVVTNHSEMVEKSLLSSDRRRLLTLYHRRNKELDTATLTLWDAATGERIAELVGHQGKINDVAFSQDGTTVLTGDEDKSARLYSANNGRFLGMLEGHGGPVQRIAFGPDRNITATCGPERINGRDVNLVRWWDAKQFLQIGPPCLSEQANSPIRFIHSDVVVSYCPNNFDSFWGVYFVKGRDQAIVVEGDWMSYAMSYARADDDFLLDSHGRIYDRTTGKRRAPPIGRKFDQAVSRFATEGRFIVSHDALFDIATEKAIGPVSRFRRAPRYAPTRRAFVCPITENCIPLHSGSFTIPDVVIVPVVQGTVDPEAAQLFVEVITCQELDEANTTRPLDEATWDKRRQRLAELLPNGEGAHLFSRAAEDRWFWLSHQADHASGEGKEEKAIKYLDRLIAADPSWSNFQRRGRFKVTLHRYEEVARDFLEAGKRAGGDGIWHASTLFAMAESLIRRAKGTQEDYRLGLQLAEALSKAKPEDRNRRILLAIAHYRLGHYAEALSVLESRQGERVRAVVSQVGQFFMPGWPVALLNRQPIKEDEMLALAFQTMTLHRLGKVERAQAGLADFRTLGRFPEYQQNVSTKDFKNWSDSNNYRDLLHEAETLIEGRSSPGK